MNSLNASRIARSRAALQRRPMAARRQRGIALTIALIVFVVVSILGIVSMRTALFQNRVSINSQLDNNAFQASESGLNVVRSLVVTQVKGPDGTYGTADDPTTNLFKDAYNDPTHPRRVCITSTSSTVDTTGTSRSGTDLAFSTACSVLPGNAARVTTLVGEGTASADMIEGYDLSGVGSAVVQVRAQGDIPNTSVTSTHIEQWATISPN